MYSYDQWCGFHYWGEWRRWGLVENRTKHDIYCICRVSKPSFINVNIIEMEEQKQRWLNSVLLLAFEARVMEKETLSWSSEVWKMPLWKLDVELGKYILTGGHARRGKTHPQQGKETLNFTVYDWAAWYHENEKRRARAREWLCCRKESIQENGEAAIVRGDTMRVRSQRWGERSTAGGLTGSWDGQREIKETWGILSISQEEHSSTISDCSFTGIRNIKPHELYWSKRILQRKLNSSALVHHKTQLWRQIKRICQVAGKMIKHEHN